MEEDIFSGIASSGQIEPKFQQTFQKNFVLVQNILDQNRLLINEINQNHESKIPDKLSRNVGLIRELNNNIRRVVDLYGHLSDSARSVEALSEGESAGATKSDGRGGHKRVSGEAFRLNEPVRATEFASRVVSRVSNFL